jgi:selenocysteine-specific elongation factor
MAAEDDAVEGELRVAQMMIVESGRAGLPVATLVSRIGVAPPAVRARVEALERAGATVRAGDLLVAGAVLDRMKASLLEALAHHHQTQPLSEGLPREEARVRIAGRGHPAVFERALEDLVAARAVVGRDRLALPTHHVALSPEVERARDRIERFFRDAGLTPPDAASVAAAAGTTRAVTEQVLHLLQRQKILVRVDTLLFHDAVLKRLKEEIRSIGAAAGPSATVDVQTFKERFGVTRKFAIPLLEYLDRERVTRRVASGRVIL